MFSSMSSFLWAFFIMFGLIIIGILFEEKLIAFEDWVIESILEFIRSKRNRKSNHV
jgi:hypothetical protein